MKFITYSICLRIILVYVTLTYDSINLPARYLLRSDVKIIEENPVIVKEDQGSLDIEFQRTGNVSELSLIRYVKI